MLVGFGSTALMYLVPSLLPSWGQHPILPGLILSSVVFIVVSLVTEKPAPEQLEPFFGEDLKDYSKNAKVRKA